METTETWSRTYIGITDGKRAVLNRTGAGDPNYAPASVDGEGFVGCLLVRFKETGMKRNKLDI